MRRAMAILACSMLLFPAWAKAQEEPRPIDMIEVRALPDASGRGSIDWWLYANGEVRLATIACVMCHLPVRRYRTFVIAPDEAARLLARLPEAEIESALSAPCTLPTAISAWARKIDLSYSLPGGGGRSNTFFINCRSPKVDRMGITLREVGEALIALEPAATPEG